MHDEKPVKLPHYSTLDGLRGIAILLVLLFHFSEVHSPTNPIWHRVWTAFGSGWCGVDLFFVLSGFLITGILLDTRGSEHYLKNFYARRTLRIFPLYYATLAAVFLVVIPLWHQPVPEGIQRMAHAQIWFWAYLANVGGFIQRHALFAGAEHGLVLNHFWSLSVEEQFYLAWPFIVIASDRTRLQKICLAIISAALLLRTLLLLRHIPYMVMYTTTPCRADSLAMGALMACLVRHPSGSLTRQSWFMPVFWGCSLLLSGVFIWRHGFHFGEAPIFTLGFTLLAAVSGCLVLMAVDPKAPQPYLRALRNPLLIWFGKYSYGMYILHNLLLPVYKNVFKLEALDQVFHVREISALVFMALSIGVTAALAFGSWQLYEKRFLRLKRYFEYEAPAAHGEKAAAA